MLITAATLFSSPCHSHPFVLLHFVFLLGTADSGKMVQVTCGILVLLALIHNELHSCTLPEPVLLGFLTARAHTFPVPYRNAYMRDQDPFLCHWLPSPLPFLLPSHLPQERRATFCLLFAFECFIV